MLKSPIFSPTESKWKTNESNKWYSFYYVTNASEWSHHRNKICTQYKYLSTPDNGKSTAYNTDTTAYNENTTTYNHFTIEYNKVSTTCIGLTTPYNASTTSYNWKNTAYNNETTAYNKATVLPRVTISHNEVSTTYIR